MALLEMFTISGYFWPIPARKWPKAPSVCPPDLDPAPCEKTREIDWRFPRFIRFSSFADDDKIRVGEVGFERHFAVFVLEGDGLLLLDRADLSRLRAHLDRKGAIGQGL